MSLAVGTQLGSLEIVALLGKGGMGEVYRAHDTKLKRDVAVKVLSDEFSRDSDRIARFQREAEVLASLNHPNIAGIYDLLELGASRYLVLELIEGETLADRLRHGPLPLEEALHTAKSICEALEAAHEKGIVHRDLKPSNVKFTEDGKVKVLDFGLAKVVGNASRSVSLSDSPTMSMTGTNPGVILGAVAYMSPEQAKGRPVDRSSDIFALGCVLFEMLTGQSAFEGEDATEILSRILQRDPDWTLIPRNVPPRVQELLRRCLEKNVKNRRHDAADVRIDIEEALAHPDIQPAPVRRTWWAAAGVAAGLLALSIALILSLSGNVPQEQSALPLRLSAETGADVIVGPLGTSGAAAVLSPDGTLLAFTGRKLSGGTSEIYVRRLDQLEASVLAGTDGARSPFFSPDGEWIGFFAAGKLKKIPVTGGTVVPLADAENARGGWWGDDNNIVYSPTAQSRVFAIPSAGGAPQTITKFEKTAEGRTEITHRWPQVLPGSRAVLFTSNTTTGNYEDGSIIVQSLVTSERKTLVREAYYGRYLQSGHIVYTQNGTVFAAPFDLQTLEITGQGVPAIERVSTFSGDGNSSIAFSNDGKAVYLAGADVRLVQPYWRDRTGKVSLMRRTPELAGLRFSPDGNRLALELMEREFSSIWVYEWERDTLSRLASGSNSVLPTWSPKGLHIAFMSVREGTQNLYLKRADGSTAEAQRLTQGVNRQAATSWHPSGRFLAFTETAPETRADIMILPMEGDDESGWKAGEPSVFLNGPANESFATFSPDGRWLACQSDETGTDEVYVRPFPGPGGKFPVSTNGGTAPLWSPSSKELFYGRSGRIMVTAYSVDGDSFRADKPRLWSEGGYAQRNGYPFGVHTDGQRLAVAMNPVDPAPAPSKLVFILNLAEELRRLAPPSGK